MDKQKSADRKLGEPTLESETIDAGSAHEAGNTKEERASEAAKEYREYQLRVFSAAQANIDAVFAYANDAIRAQSMSELIERPAIPAATSRK